MDHPNRRKFLGSAASLGFTMGFAQASAAQNSEAETKKFELSAATQRLLSQFGLQYPIFQAATGSTSGPDLATLSPALAQWGAWPCGSFLPMKHRLV